MDENTNETPSFEIPADVAAIEDLTAAREAARTAFDQLRQVGDDLTDDQVAQMEAIAEHVSALDNESTARVEATAARQARAEAAAALLEAPDDGEGDGGDDGDGDGDGEVAPSEPVAVAASSVRVARRVPNPRPASPRSGISLTAAADVPGFQLGSQIADRTALANAAIARSRGFAGMPTPRPGGAKVRQQFNVATIARGTDAFDGLSIDQSTMSQMQQQEIIQRAASEARLTGNSLTAAGGWCAPSENLYELCDGLESLEGLIDLPEIQVTRGGINFTSGPDFSTIFTNTGFLQTEGQAEAGTEKTCYEVACPDFVEVRLDAIGVCIQAPLLTRSAYPELIERWIAGSLVAHQHKVSAAMIARMQTALGSALTVIGSGSTSASVLTALELQATALRYTYRMPVNATLEVVAPLWLKPVVRADLSLRTGVDDSAITDAQIAEHFAARNLSVQWVYNYQDAGATTTMQAGTIPTTVEVMIYPAGTFVKGVADVINLDTVYDSTLLSTNMFTALFMEEGILLAKTCYGGRRLTIPLCVTGRTGAADIVTCYGVADEGA